MGALLISLTLIQLYDIFPLRSRSEQVLVYSTPLVESYAIGVNIVQIASIYVWSLPRLILEAL